MTDYKLTDNFMPPESFRSLPEHCLDNKRTPDSRVDLPAQPHQTRRSSRLAKLQAKSVAQNVPLGQSITETHNGSFNKHSRGRTNSRRFESPALDVKHSISLRKSSEVTGPTQPHSTASSCIDSKSSSSDTLSSDTLSSDDDCHTSPLYHHKSRISNSRPSIDTKKKPKINYPKSSALSEWKILDQELEIALPKIFKPGVLENLPIQELVDKFDNWLHAFLLDRCGSIKPGKKYTPFKKRENKSMIRLRQDKNRVRKAVRALKNAGLAGTPKFDLLNQEWMRLMRRHNRLRRSLRYAQVKKEKLYADKKFKQNPVKFARDLFNKDISVGDPTFSKKVADDYFAPLYHDSDRQECYEPLDDMVRPPSPDHLFNLKPPSLKDVFRSVRKKSNSASPGFNSLSYLVYKRCPITVKYLHKIFRRIWDTQDVPESWASAFISLISKSDRRSDPAEFRPIAVTNTAGKIFFTIISDRLQTFKVANNFIKRSIQKGFLSGVSGCVDHTFALWEALRDAKQEKRSIVVSWIDLANAFGSVRHNLIQFALNWYHVPPMIQALIFDYYEKLCATVITKDWSTGFFLFDIGCFQGCVLSTILFDAVFNLLLDFLQPLKKSGYLFKDCGVISFEKAYADDLALITKTAAENQVALDRMVVWLDWTGTMKAKPKKCIATAFRQFKRGTKSINNFKPYHDTVYSLYNPCLKIKGHLVGFIMDPSKGPFKDEHFKFLGRWIPGDLDEIQVKEKVLSEFRSYISLIDNSKLSGLLKIWLYQHFLLAKLAWSFLIHDFCMSFAKEKLQPIATRTLKKWAGIFRSADVGLLYRSRSRFGLGLTSILLHFKKMQVVKCLLLKHSVDDDVKRLLERKVQKEAPFRNRNHTVWRATHLLSEVETVAQHQFQFQSSSNHCGLGFGNFRSKLSPKEYRDSCVSAVSILDAEQYWSHAHQLPLQGVWTHWFDCTRPLDFSWNTLIYGPGKRIISFLLNASINSLPTPDMLKLMKYRETCECVLCGAVQCTLFHILAGCDIALTSKRYTWRHDSVLLTIRSFLEERLRIQNNSSCAPISVPHISKSFHSANSKPIRKGSSVKQSSNLLSTANDWELLVDLDHAKIVFPPEIYPTNQRPDIIIWSRKKKSVILIELTCPAEENISASNVKKLARYDDLQAHVRIRAWSCVTMAIEAGARGFVAKSMHNCFRKLGFSFSKASSMCKAVSSVVARCSYYIWMSRNNKQWCKNVLLTPMLITNATHSNT
jgi:hypothetical protein